MKTLALRARVFIHCFLVFGYPGETLALVVHILHEKRVSDNGFTGRVVLHVEPNMFVYFSSICAAASSENAFEAVKKEIFQKYLRRDIYLHETVFDFFKIVHTHKPQIFYDNFKNE